MKNNQLVSTIIPVYNGEKYIDDAIQSIFSQNYQPIELIVINDGSTDNTGEILRGYGQKIHVFDQDNQGISSALNLGISKANGSFFAFLDADDLWTPEKIFHQMQIFNESPGVDIVFGLVKQFYCPELSQREKKRFPIRMGVQPGYFKTTCIVRRSSFEKVGLFKEDIKAGDFVEWFARAEDTGLQSHLIEEIVGHRRIHTDNTNSRSPNPYQDYTRILKNVIDRRRKNSL